MPRSALPIAFVLGAVLAGGELPAQAGDPDGAWTTHRHDTAGYRIDHPRGWTYLAAEPRDGSGQYSVAQTLYPGELDKVTFRETGEHPWPGSLQVRIAPNPGRLSPREWLVRSDCAECVDDGEVRSPIDGREAMSWDLWQLDAVLYGVVIADGDRMVEITYNLSPGNDPETERHEAVYQRMIESFRFLQD